MKTLKVRCRVRGEEGWFQVRVGQPAPGFHPLHFQAAWLREIREGVIDREAMEAIEEILTTARDKELPS
jgi:hypothetical protein